MATADDTKLLQLSSPRAAELFPVLNRAGALLPLLAVLAVVPALAAVHYGRLDDRGALWGLKSLEILTAANIDGVVDPELSGPAAALRSQPPLGSWLTALAMGLLGASQPAALLLVSLLAAAALVAMSYVLFRRLAGPRVAFWGTVMLAFHGPVLAQAGDPAPVALAAFLAVVSFWGYLAHLEEESAPATFKLLVGGVALGLCLLAGGLPAVAVPVVLLISSGTLHPAARSILGPILAPKRDANGWAALRSLGLFTMTGFAIGGWWVLMMGSRHGSRFFIEWLTGDTYGLLGVSAGGGAAGVWVGDDSVPDGAASRVGRVLHAAVETLGLLLGLTALGVWRAVRGSTVAANAAGESDRRWSRVLIVWAGCALAGGAFISSGRDAAPFAAEVWRIMLVIPCLGLAALAVEDIARRRVGLATVAAMTCATIAAPLAASWLLDAAAWQSGVALSWTTLAATVIAAGAWCLARICRDRESGRRVVLAGLVIALIAGNAVAGLRSVRAARPDDRMLDRLRRDLGEAPSDVAATCIVTRQTSPVRLEFVLRSLWPQIRVTSVEDWDAAALAFPSDSDGFSERIIAAEWVSVAKRRRDAVPDGWELTPIGSPQFYQGRQLRAYVLTREVSGEW